MFDRIQSYLAQQAVKLWQYFLKQSGLGRAIRGDQAGWDELEFPNPPSWFQRRFIERPGALRRFGPVVKWKDAWQLFGPIYLNQLARLTGCDEETLRRHRRRLWSFYPVNIAVLLVLGAVAVGTLLLPSWLIDPDMTIEQAFSPLLIRR
jgi:hypothetical protein